MGKGDSLDKEQFTRGIQTIAPKMSNAEIDAMFSRACHKSKMIKNVFTSEMENVIKNKIEQNKEDEYQIENILKKYAIRNGGFITVPELSFIMKNKLDTGMSNEEISEFVGNLNNIYGNYIEVEEVLNRLCNIREKEEEGNEKRRKRKQRK